ncbi:protein of unknown function [Moritella yayanosii]|uniref:Uncharacterized protein n=1 Tax=Moritella yayanosii TaxID=69539 RepID=A0A330LMY7_9GAMM|nr:protein of unknown function [Moritella yayanosii]
MAGCRLSARQIISPSIYCSKARLSFANEGIEFDNFLFPIVIIFVHSRSVFIDSEFAGMEKIAIHKIDINQDTLFLYRLITLYIIPNLAAG